MNAIPKKKLCWNCEGRVAFSDENCPYCGVYLSSSTLINNENSIYIPSNSQIQEKIDNQASEDNEASITHGESIDQEEALLPNQGSGILAMSLLLIGSIFFVFGLILLVFSKEGVLTLQWNASYWYVYSAIAALSLIVGWKSLKD